MSHSRIIIIGKINTVKTLLDALVLQVEAADDAWQESEQAGQENLALHEWLETVQDCAGEMETTVSTLAANCPQK